MQKLLQISGILFTLIFLLSSCEAIGAIFKAGIWTGILIVALVVALIIFIARTFGGKK